MLHEARYEDFFDAPVGRYTVTGSSVVWCESPALCGSILWAAQDEHETRRILAVFDQHRRHMQSGFDVVLDTRGVQSVDPSCLQILIQWMKQRKDTLLPHVRRHVNVIRDGPIGLMLTGLLPVLGWTHDYRLCTDASEAFRSVDADERLRDEVDAIAARLRGTPDELRALWTLLERGTELDTLTIERASALLATSTRTLQRVLTTHGTSFRQELADARFARAQTLLRASDDKITAVSAAVGLSERALTDLFNRKTGLSPAVWRKRAKERDEP